MIRTLQSAALMLVWQAGVWQAGAQDVPTAQPQAAQTVNQTVNQTAGQTAPYTLRTGTRLVVVDVQVEDSMGRPVHDLGRSDFTLEEDGKAQTLRNFEEHRPPAATATPVARTAMPPGEFTDYEPVPPQQTLNIFLLDELNTSEKDQTYAIDQLLKFAAHAPAGTRIAIFGLRSRLYLLNGFTTDVKNLEDALRHKVRPGASLLLDDPGGTHNDPATAADLVTAGTPPSAQPSSNDLLAATLNQFEADRQSFQTQLRIEYTLDAFNELARYLGNFPGRKNLFWFSAAFPINLAPNPALTNGFSGAQGNGEEYRETVDLLSRAQVSMYPVDARGLETPPLYDAGSSGRAFARTPNAVSAQLNNYYANQALEHQTMDAIAADTGGHAVYNTNGLAEAVGTSMEAGAHYYTLAYTPAENTRGGDLRHLRVTLNGRLAASGLHLIYRQTYLTAGKEASPAEPATTSETAKKYARLAISHGAPTPSDLLVKVSVRPEGTGTEAEVAAGNQLVTANKAHGPYRGFAVEFAALPSQIRMVPDAQGRRHGAVEFSAFVFDSDGNVLNTAGRKVDLDLTPENYRRFLGDAVRFHLVVSAPAGRQSFLRLVVHDVTGDRFGVIEVSTGQIDAGQRTTAKP